jgi:hypothetical protein
VNQPTLIFLRSTIAQGKTDLVFFCTHLPLVSGLRSPAVRQGDVSSLLRNSLIVILRDWITDEKPTSHYNLPDE